MSKDSAYKSSNATHSRGRIVRKSADQIPRATPRQLAQLRAAMDRPIDTSDIPPRRVGSAPVRRIEGRLPNPPRGILRSSILAELGRRQITRYQLWKLARKHCPTLPESAVYEFLRGQRQIGLRYIEALLCALSLRIAPAAA